MSRTDIFLSYARQDRTTARMFAEGLADEGFSVWWDASLHSGETFDEVIEQKLRDAGAVVVLWSPRSVASRWVRAEATLADRRKKLAPAIIEPCDRPIIFELTHAADLCEWTGDINDIHWQAFMEDLRRLIESQSDTKDHDTVQPGRHRSAPNRGDVAERARGTDRRPLRPGSDDVIHAGRVHNEPARSEAVGARAQPAAETEPLSEVHCLEVEDAEDLFVVGASGLKIGRTAPADIVLSHKSVSREHCIIGLANDELLVTDLSSTNGTFIDGARISRATILPVGSVLRIGQISLKHAVRSPTETEQGDHPHNTRGNHREGRLAATS